MVIDSELSKENHPYSWHNSTGSVIKIINVIKNVQTRHPSRKRIPVKPKYIVYVFWLINIK